MASVADQAKNLDVIDYVLTSILNFAVREHLSGSLYINAYISRRFYSCMRDLKVYVLPSAVVVNLHLVECLWRLYGERV